MSLRVLLTLVLGGLLLFTAGFVGWLGYANSHRVIKNFTEQEFALANAVAAHEVTDFLDDPANRLLDEYRVRARRGMIHLTNDRELGFDFIERLRVHPTLAWISYSDAKTGHFIGARRNSAGALILNISTANKDDSHEEIVTVDGKEIPLDKPGVKNFDPRLRDWYVKAVAVKATVWSEPYKFVDGPIGITASRAWRPIDGAEPQGVFTVDFYLRDLQGLLDSVSKVDGFTVILEPDGKLLCCSDNPFSIEMANALGGWVRAHSDFKSINGIDTSHLIPIKVGTTTYLAACDHISANSGLKCVVASIISEPAIYQRINHATGQTASLAGIIALLMALAAGWIMAYRISSPLKALGNDLAKVGQFHLASEVIPNSVVFEVNQLRDAADRMKSGLRSFIKYVPDDLVRRLLSSGKEAVLGGEIRRLTVFLSDIEGFTAHTQQSAPNVLVGELSVYFEVLSRRLRQHSGTIDKFIGDGLLVFFNAPENVPLHENLACRGSVIALEELALLQKEEKTAHFRTRVGLHSGDVLVGNIGTAERFAYTVLGDVVNVASRLESLNKVYGTQILASSEVRGHAGEGFEWRHLDRVAVFGRQGSMDIYELMGLKDGVDKNRLQSRKLYQEALDLYFARSLADSRRLFAQVAAQSPEDKAAALMMTRCDHMLTLDVPADWDGVFVYDFK